MSTEKRLCCERMALALRGLAPAAETPPERPDCALGYQPEEGRFGVLAHDGADLYLRLRECPWCSADLAGFALREFQAEQGERPASDS